MVRAGKSGKMAEFTGKTLTTSGIYMVKSDRMKTVGFFTSANVEVRVRRVKSDYLRGNRQVFLERMGIRWSGDVEFSVVETCRREIFGIRLRFLAEEWMAKGYEVWGWQGGLGEPRAETWAPCQKLRALAEKYGMGDGDVMVLLDNVGMMLGAGAGARPGGRD